MCSLALMFQKFRKGLQCKGLITLRNRLIEGFETSICRLHCIVEGVRESLFCYSCNSRCHLICKHTRHSSNSAESRSHFGKKLTKDFWALNFPFVEHYDGKQQNTTMENGNILRLDIINFVYWLINVVKCFDGGFFSKSRFFNGVDLVFPTTLIID